MCAALKTIKDITRNVQEISQIRNTGGINEKDGSQLPIFIKCIPKCRQYCVEEAIHPYIGATPDNVFTCKCCKRRICVEYKCPYSIRELDVSESWDKTDCL